MYDSSRQYRCTIIRGKSQKEMDDLLPIYAKVISEICPCSWDEFETKFNNLFETFLPASERIKKTLDNHRTEISGKLFGMYYFAEDGMVYESERTQKFLEDNDQPAFFKDVCYKMQFPNGMQKTSTTVMERISDGIRLRPNSFILKLLLLAKEAKISIHKKEIGYYVLNSLDVLQGKARPTEVLEAIKKDQSKGIQRDIYVPGKASSYNWQHINEQLNYLELANLIRFTDDKKVFLNTGEMRTIEIFAAEWDKDLLFDVYSYDLSSLEGRKQFQFDWDAYFGKLSKYSDQFNTQASSLIVSKNQNNQTSATMSVQTQTTEIGDEGEAFVFEYEKKRVASFNKRLVNKVLALGKTKGLGYDIQSVIAEPGEKAEFVKYIEVKTTKRYTCPDINDNLWLDTLEVTRNEWVAAQQHKEFYAIFRVYFTQSGTSIFVLSNPWEKAQNNEIQVTPIRYRVDFNNNAVDSVINDPTMRKGNYQNA